MRNVKYTRARFDPSQQVVCTREFLYGGMLTIPGDIFPVPSRKDVTRARQLYEMRKLEHLDTFIHCLDARADYTDKVVSSESALVIKKVEKKKVKVESIPDPMSAALAAMKQTEQSIHTE